jgi:hypothetical protein
LANFLPQNFTQAKRVKSKENLFVSHLLQQTAAAAAFQYSALCQNDFWPTFCHRILPGQRGLKAKKIYLFHICCSKLLPLLHSNIPRCVKRFLATFCGLPK